MASLRKFNANFDLDIEECVKQDLLRNKIIDSIDEVRFHLECAVQAYSNEQSLRYLPHLSMYLDVSVDIERFFKSFHKQNICSSLNTIVKYAKSKKRNFDWISECAKTLKIRRDLFEEMMHFTVFSCDLALSIEFFDSSSTFFFVQLSDEKESAFRKVKGRVTYLIHQTRPESVYSIRRNGIMNMSNNDKFQVNGAIYGPGIYMSYPLFEYSYQYGSVSLCYAVKNAECRHQINDIYVVQSKQVCLRAIVWGACLNAKMLKRIREYHNI